MAVIRSAVRRSIVVAALMSGVICAGFAVAQTTQPQAATKPAATKPTGRTYNDLVLEKLAFDEEFVIKAFAEKGKHDPEWDEQAKAFLRAQVDAEAYFNAEAGRYYRPAGLRVPPELSDRIAQVRKLLATGCDDVMVLYYAAKVIGFEGTPDGNQLSRLTYALRVCPP
ncbi:MAG: hypothetical protein QM702_03625 [Rubrivivax sp.]